MEVRNLLSVEGLRHFLSSFVDNFAGFGVVAVILISMAGVGAIFCVNLLITPSDSMLVEVTNEVLGKAGMDTLAVTQNYYFAIVSSILMAAVACS